MNIKERKEYFSKKAEKFALKYQCLCLLYSYKYIAIKPIFSSALLAGAVVITTLLLSLRDSISIFRLEALGLSLLVNCVMFFVFWFPALISEHPENIPRGFRILNLNKRYCAIIAKNNSRK